MQQGPAFSKNINAADRNGDTALHRAVIDGALEAVESLLIAGANPDIRNKIGHTPLVTLFHINVQKIMMDDKAYQRYVQIGLLLIEKSDLKIGVVYPKKRKGKPIESNEIITPLQFALASSFRHKCILDAFIARNAHRIEGSPRFELDPGLLAESCTKGKVAELKLFLTAGVSPNTKAQDTPLYWAMSTGQVEAAKILLAHGAEVTTLPERLEDFDAFGNKTTFRIISPLALVIDKEKVRIPNKNPMMLAFAEHMEQFPKATKEKILLTIQQFPAVVADIIIGYMLPVELYAEAAPILFQRAKEKQRALPDSSPASNYPPSATCCSSGSSGESVEELEQKLELITLKREHTGSMFIG